jgi:hypothetical protein
VGVRHRRALARHYEIRATRDGGVRGESTGSDYATLLQDLKRWAHGVDEDFARRNR